MIGALAVALALLASVPLAHAGPEIGYGGELYQDELVDAARARERLERDPSPQGKTIERIVAAPYDVITEGEPYPKLLNWFHVTTLPEVVERELLFKVGDAWNDSFVAETGRNLRAYLFVTSARIVPCKGSAPDRITVLVVTKDLWSLRPNADFLWVGSQLQTLDAELTEENLAGRNKRATIDLGLTLATYYGGLQYQDPRLNGSTWTLASRGDLYWNRSSGALEGGIANLTVQNPLRSLGTEWGWIGSFKYRKDIYRLFSGGGVAQYVAPSTGQRMPYRLDRRTLELQAGVLRSFGRERKLDYSFGYRAFTKRYGVPALSTPVQAATQAAFEADVLPRSENVGLAYAGVRSYDARFRELIDIETFALTEDFRFGADLAAEVRAATPAFGFSSTFIEPVVDLKWSAYEWDDLFTATASADIRYQPQLNLASNWVNGSFTAGLRNVSPRFSVFRLHTSVRGGRRINDLTQSFNALGGDGSLRGYPSAYLIGANFWAANAELRTKPLTLATLHVGFAGFFDVGGASDDLARMGAHAAVGGGLRIGLPQFNRQILRVDLGLPLEGLSAGYEPAYLVAQYGQAF